MQRDDGFRERSNNIEPQKPLSAHSHSIVAGGFDETS